MSEEALTPEVIVEEPAKERIVEAVLEAEEAAQILDETTPAKDSPEIKVGYVVGLTVDGNFAFKILGTDPTLLEVQALNLHAAERIRLLYTQNQGGGDSLVLELGRLVAELDKKVTIILDKVAPSKPDNQLK